MELAPQGHELTDLLGFLPCNFTYTYSFLNVVKDLLFRYIWTRIFSIQII